MRLSTKRLILFVTIAIPYLFSLIRNTVVRARQKDLPASHRAGSTSEPAGRTSRLRRPREQRKPSHTRTHEARDRVACPRRRDRRPTVPLSSQGRCGGRGASLEPGAAHLQVHGGPRRAAGPDAEPPMSARPVKSPRFGRAVRPVALGAAGRMKGTLVCALRRNESESMMLSRVRISRSALKGCSMTSIGYCLCMSSLRKTQTSRPGR